MKIFQALLALSIAKADEHTAHDAAAASPTAPPAMHESLELIQTMMEVMMQRMPGATAPPVSQ